MGRKDLDFFYLKMLENGSRKKCENHCPIEYVV